VSRGGSGKISLSAAVSSIGICVAIITLDPKLIDIIWNAKSERIITRLNQLNGGKPALE
jgi:putative exporter of polyketide antibiotics